MPHLSASQLEVFLGCNKKWVAQYIDGTKGDPSEALGLGGAFHETLENFGNERKKRPTYPANVDVMKQEFSRILIRTMSEQDPHGKLLSLHGGMEAKGHAMIEAFCKSVAPQYQPLVVEESFDFDIPRMDPYKGERWTFTGRIDARTSIPAGLVTVDWKTGKKWRENAEHEKLQATVYLLADLVRGLPVPARVTFITFPVDWDRSSKTFSCTADIRPTTRTLPQVSAAMQNIRSAAIQINQLRDTQGKGATPTPSYLCPWCPVYSRCHAGQSFMVEKNKLAAVTVDENDTPLPLENAS